MDTRRLEDRFDRRPARQYERTWKKLEGREVRKDDKEKERLCRVRDREAWRNTWSKQKAKKVRRKERIKEEEREQEGKGEKIEVLSGGPAGRTVRAWAALARSTPAWPPRPAELFLLSLARRSLLPPTLSVFLPPFLFSCLVSLSFSICLSSAPSFTLLPLLVAVSSFRLFFSSFHPTHSNSLSPPFFA